jgi:hypothetical protein
VTPGAIVQLVFTARLAMEDDYKVGLQSGSFDNSSNEDSEIEEDDVDILIGSKKSHSDGDPVPLALAHAPYFPVVLELNQTLAKW